MSILNLPSLSRTVPSSFKLSLVTNTMFFDSPLNGAMQTTEMPGARWRSTFQWRNLTAADARIVKAWLNKLSGRAGRFYLYDFLHQTPSGTAAGTPLVKGAGQVGRTLLTDGWTPNQTNLLLPGDYFGVGSQLLIVTAPISSDGSGNATLQFESPLRAIPADNAVITTTRPTAIMMLENDDQDDFLFDEPNVTSISISAVEMF